MASFKYRIRYTRNGSNGQGSMSCVEDVYGVSAPSALGEFHRRMQKTSHISEFGKQVLRPQLKFDEYTVDGICLLYNSDPTGNQRGEVIESKFDLPPYSRNPDLSPRPQHTNEMVMPFFDECATGRLSS